MRLRTENLGRETWSPVGNSRFGLEERSNPLASAPAQGRRRAVRAQSLAILHKVGCSWSARPAGVLRTGSAGPTTRPRFEPIRSTPAGRQTGEPTVSHEGCSGFDFSFFFIGGLPAPCTPAEPAYPPPPRVASRGTVRTRVACTRTRVVRTRVVRTRVACTRVACTRVACTRVACTRVACTRVACTRVVRTRVACTRVACARVVGARVVSHAVACTRVACTRLARGRLVRGRLARRFALGSGV
jgi:hypothetical protein